MKRRVGLTVLLVLSVGLALQHVRVEQQDKRWLLNVYEAQLDVQGFGHDQWSKLYRLTQNCARLPSDATKSQLLNIIQSYSLPDSASAQLVYVATHEHWALAEVWFDKLSPAVVLLKQENSRWQIEPAGIWSGTTHPWRASPFIREFLLSRNPDFPIALLHCWQAQHALWNH